MEERYQLNLTEAELAVLTILLDGDDADTDALTEPQFAAFISLKKKVDDRDLITLDE